MRDEDQRFESAGAGVGGHRSRSVAGRDAGHALHPEPARLGNAARHAVVFERAGGIEALVLESELVESAVLRRARAAQQGRVAFAQSHDVPVVIDEREQLAIAPDAALIERRVGHPALAPGPFQRRGIGTPEIVSRFEQPAALRAVIEDFGDVVARTARGVDTNQIRLHGKLRF